MKGVDTLCSLAVMMVALVFIAACGPKQTFVEDHEFTVDISGLELDQSQSPHKVYVRPGAPSLSEFNRYIIDSVQIVYNDPQMKELSPEMVLKMRLYFREAVVRELRMGGYEIGTKSQADTMRVSFVLSNLKAPSEPVRVAAGLMPVSLNVGEVTIEVVFREALTNRIEAVVVSHSRSHNLWHPGPWTSWADITHAFDTWAKGFREAVDKAHSQN